MTSKILLWLTLTSTNKTTHSLTVHTKTPSTIMLKLCKEINAKDLSGIVTLKQECIVIVSSFQWGLPFLKHII